LDGEAEAREVKKGSVPKVLGVVWGVVAVWWGKMGVEDVQRAEDGWRWRMKIVTAPRVKAVRVKKR
jgi:hypothetical protein